MDAVNPGDLDPSGTARYRVISDPREADITVYGRYDGVICTGDILDLAPPPGNTPSGSVIDELHDDAAAVYEERPEQVIDAVSRLNEQEVYAAARERYETFFDTLETPFYYVAGNQDVPDALRDAAEGFNDVRHASQLDRIQGEDGWVPAFADLPAGSFPAERERGAFLDALSDADAPVLIAHTLPPDGYAAYGFDAALGSGRDSETVQETERGVELPSYRETGKGVDLFLPVE